MYTAEYQEKLTTPEKAVACIRNSDTVIHSMAIGEPPSLLGAIADRVRKGNLRDIKIFSLLHMDHAAKTILSPDVCDKIHIYSWFVGSPDRVLIKTGRNFYVPNEFHQIPKICRDFMDIDIVVTTVSPMDKAGYFTFGVTNDYISTAARHCKKLIVEVNPQMPRVFGDSLLHISEVDAIVEYDTPLMEYKPKKSKPEAEIIGRKIAELIPDGATIQLGIGGIPNAIGSSLENHKDLGAHSEVMCSGMVNLIKKGVVTGRKKNLNPRKHVFTNVLGDKEMYDFIDDNPSMESYPVSYINSPYIISQNDNMISINSTIEVDLLGQCNSEFIGGYEFSGAGGQLDFVRGAFKSEGGKSFIAFYSTAHDGNVSRIVSRFKPGTAVTTPRMDTHYLVTEYGLFNMKGKSTRERALDIINLAHPKFRDDLVKEAEKMHLI